MRLDIYLIQSFVLPDSPPILVSHTSTLVRIFQYSKGTSHLKLSYVKVGTTTALLMYGNSDADWATTDLDERSSCIVATLYFYQDPIFRQRKFGGHVYLQRKVNMGAELLSVFKTFVEEYRAKVFSSSWSLVDICFTSFIFILYCSLKLSCQTSHRQPRQLRPD